MSQPVVTHISDTARWVASYRAEESARGDALFHDPFAARLAGSRGPAIARAMVPTPGMGWPIVVRTKLLDDFVLQAVAEGADRVLNLAAGFDARPYRLALPPELSWIEADFPEMIAEKERVLANDRPVCRLTRRAVDLGDAQARRAFLREALAGAKHGLVITEGLLMYLEAATVTELGRDLAACPEVESWLTDLVSPLLVRGMQAIFSRKLGEGTRLHFGPSNGPSFFAPLGFRLVAQRELLSEAHRLRRLPWYLKPFARSRPAPGKGFWSGVVRLGRA